MAAIPAISLPQLYWPTRAAPATDLPLFGPACAVSLLAGVMACLQLPRLPPAWLLLLLLASGLGLALHGDARRALGVFVLGAALAGLQATASLDAQLPPALEREAIVVRGQIVELPVHAPRSTRFAFVVDDARDQPAPVRGKRLRLGWYVDEDPAIAERQRGQLRAGSRWELPVRLRAPRGLRNPGGGDGEKRAMAERIAAVGHVLEPALAVPLAPARGIDAWRERMSARIAMAVPSASSRYVRALALGDTRALDDADWARLRAAGLTHLIAISGFHVGLVAGFFALLGAAAWWAMPALGRRMPRITGAGLAAVAGAFLYCALTGFAVPTVRTALMIAALVAARCLRRRQRTGDTLALGCIVLLLLDPLAVLGAGFWLSFVGVAWLLWSLPAQPRGGRWGLLHGFLGAQAVATLGLLPLTVMLFGQASVAGPLANLAAVPWWSLVVIPLALLGVLADTLWPGMGAPFWQLSAWMFDLLWPALATIADSRLAMAWLPEPRWYAGALALLSVFWWLLPRGLPGKPLALLLWLPLLLPPRELPRPGEVELTVVDVGQGLAVLVRTAQRSLLYDMGPAMPDGFDAGEHAVLPALRALGVRTLDAAVLSHGDNDHAGGWPAIARALPVAALLAPEGSHAPGLSECRAGDAWTWDGVRFRILHPSPGFPYLGNEASCVLRIESAHGSVLLTGDIGHYVERGLLREARHDLRADVVLVPHHGSAGSSDAGFVSATKARLALVSSGAGNRFRHPRPDVVARWCQAGAEVLDTATSGAIRVWLGADGLQLRERRRSHPRLWDAAHRRARLAGRDAGLCYPPDS